MTEESLRITSAIEQIDATYEALMTAAERLADAFGQEARAIQRKNATTHVPIFLTVSQTSPNAKSITWQRMQFFRGVGGQKATCKPRGIPKGGRGHSYPASAFTFIKGSEMRELVRRYERTIAQIREVASDNRTLRRKLLAELTKAEKLLRALDDADDTIRVV